MTIHTDKPIVPPLPIDASTLLRSRDFRTPDQIALTLLLTLRCWEAAHNSQVARVNRQELELVSPTSPGRADGWPMVLLHDFWWTEETGEIYSPYVLELIGRPTQRTPIPSWMRRKALAAGRWADEPDAPRWCHFCEQDIEGPFHLDHLLPLSRGGIHHPLNLAVTCPACNLAKGARTASEFQEFRAEVNANG